jgi:LmbE family N-acetylglucosaminyl deacetylase
MHPEHRSIGELAYRLWQARGCPDGTAEQDWLEAEKQLRGPRPVRGQSSEAVDDSLKSTFPASDPPASHLPDVPPANAAAKWKAAEASRAETARAEPSRTEPMRAEPSRAAAARKNPQRRRSELKSDKLLPGESKPSSLSKPRNDRPS